MATSVWKERFAPYQVMSSLDQERHKDEILKLFKDFWVTMPDEDLFSECVTGLVIEPKMFHVMATYRAVGGRRIRWQ